MKTLEEIDREVFNMPHLFISGPYTSLDSIESMADLASIVAYQAWVKGWAVISVHKNCSGYMPNGAMDYDRWLVATMAQISRCDAVLVLPGWEVSDGVKGEIEFAGRNNIPVFFFEWAIPDARKKGV